MKVRSITNRLSTSPGQRRAIEFAFDSAGVIYDFALQVALNEISFIPSTLPSKYSFYKKLVCSKTNLPRLEVLKDRKMVSSPRETYYLPKAAVQDVIYDVWSVLNSFKENFWTWKQEIQKLKQSQWRTKPKPPQTGVKPRGFSLATGGTKARSVRVDHDTLTLPASLGRPVVPLPKELRDKLDIVKIQRVRLFPRWGEIYVTIAYQVMNDKIPSPPHNRCLSIDPGVDSLAMVNNIGLPPMLLKLSTLKYENYNYRVTLGHLRSIYRKQNIQSGPALDRLLRERYGFFRTEFGRLSNFLITYAVKHRIGRIIIGRNKGWKNRGKLSSGKVTSAFQLLPFKLFHHALKCKAELLGIEIVLQNESYTSKASFDDGDYPSRNFRSQNGGFSGNRTAHREYVTARGFSVHADVNAAANILRKYSPSLASTQNVRIFNPVTVKWWA